MKAFNAGSFALVAVGFVAGIAATSLPVASAPPDASAIDPSSKPFMVSIVEVKKNFVFAEEFSGSFKKTVTMSDGSVRKIALRPMLKDGRLVVEFKDTGGLTYMGSNGTTTNGTLMVQLRDMEQVLAEFAAFAR